MFPHIDTSVPELTLTGEETLYVELDSGKKLSCQNCKVIFLATGDIQVLRRIGDRIYNSLYYKEHIIYYTLTLYGDDTDE